jgi:hypothetical protein
VILFLRLLTRAVLPPFGAATVRERTSQSQPSTLTARKDVWDKHRSLTLAVLNGTQTVREGWHKGAKSFGYSSR